MVVRVRRPRRRARRSPRSRSCSWRCPSRSGRRRSGTGRRTRRPRSRSAAAAIRSASSASSSPSSAFTRAAAALIRPSQRTTGTGIGSPETGKFSTAFRVSPPQSSFGAVSLTWSSLSTRGSPVWWRVRGRSSHVLEQDQPERRTGDRSSIITQAHLQAQRDACSLARSDDGQPGSTRSPPRTASITHTHCHRSSWHPLPLISVMCPSWPPFLIFSCCSITPPMATACPSSMATGCQSLAGTPPPQLPWLLPLLPSASDEVVHVSPPPLPPNPWPAPWLPVTATCPIPSSWPPMLAWPPPPPPPPPPSSPTSTTSPSCTVPCQEVMPACQPGRRPATSSPHTHDRAPMWPDQAHTRPREGSSIIMPQDDVISSVGTGRTPPHHGAHVPMAIPVNVSIPLCTLLLSRTPPPTASHPHPHHQQAHHQSADLSGPNDTTAITAPPSCCSIAARRRPQALHYPIWPSESLPRTCMWIVMGSSFPTTIARWPHGLLLHHRLHLLW